MISITPKAEQMLKQKQAEAVEAFGVGLRLAVTPAGQVALAAGPAQAGDQTIEQGGDVLLAVDGDLAKRLDGTTIDCKETDEGARFTIRRPPSA